tara:strand:+ start:1248 stop:1598 length:351 start_codon:yes stop_codon:yes gene_type:complete
MKTRKALIIKTDGSVQVIELGKTSNDEYEALSGAVGGFIQQVPLDDSGMMLFCHEEGKLIGLPYNEGATKVWEQFWGKTDVMVGDCVVTGDIDWDSELTIGLSDESLEGLWAIING